MKAVSAKDVEVFMEMNDALYGRDVQREVSNIAAARNVALAAEVGRSKYMTTSYIKVGNLSPGQSVLVGTEIRIDRTTVLDVPVEATTKDDVKIKFTIRTVGAFVVNIKVIYENANPIDKDLRIQFRKGSAKRLEQFLAEEGKLIQELSRLKERVSMPRCFIFFEEYEYVGDPLGKARYRIYRAKSNSMKVIKGNLVIIKSETIKDNRA
jgi:hypothetical protein